MTAKSALHNKCRGFCSDFDCRCENSCVIFQMLNIHFISLQPDPNIIRLLSCVFMPKKSSAHALSTHAHYSKFIRSWSWRRLKQLLCPLWGAGSITATAFSVAWWSWTSIVSSGFRTLWRVLSVELHGQLVLPIFTEELHCLHVRQHVQFKLAATTFEVKNSGLPACLHEDLHDYQPTRMLRSFTAHLLQRPLVHTSVASHAFTVAAPTMWNSLSVNTWSAQSFVSYKCRLKCKLFASTYASNANCLHLLTPLRMVQHYHSTPICVLHIRLCFINLVI